MSKIFKDKAIKYVHIPCPIAYAQIHVWHREKLFEITDFLSSCFEKKWFLHNYKTCFKHENQSEPLKLLIKADWQWLTRSCQVFLLIHYLCLDLYYIKSIITQKHLPVQIFHCIVNHLNCTYKKLFSVVLVNYIFRAGDTMRIYSIYSYIFLFFKLPRGEISLWNLFSREC